MNYQKISDKELEAILNEMISNAGNSIGTTARFKYEAINMVREKNRSRILYINTLLLTFIALGNIVLAFLNFEKRDKPAHVYVLNSSCGGMHSCDTLTSIKFISLPDSLIEVSDATKKK